MDTHDPIFTAVPKHPMLSNEPEPPTDSDIAWSKATEQACAKRADRSKVYRYIIHGIWIPIVACVSIVWFNLLIYSFFNIELIKGLI